MRDFLIENALYWIEEYSKVKRVSCINILYKDVDGFRLDATHALVDNSEKHILQELVEQCATNSRGKHILFYAEDDRNETKIIRDSPQGKEGEMVME